MINKTRRTLAILVALILCLGIFTPINSLAEETEKVSNQISGLEKDLDAEEIPDQVDEPENDLLNEETSAQTDEPEQNLEEVEEKEIFANTQATSEENLNYLFFDLDVALEKGGSHMSGTNSSINVYPEVWRTAWKNLKITITDKQGNVFESPHYYVKGMKETSDTESPTSAFRYGGAYKEGEILTVTVDTSGIPDGYHMSFDSGYYSGDPYSGYGDIYYKKSYEQGSSYNTFSFPYTILQSNGMYVRIPMGMLDLKFDPQGGNFDGSTEAILKPVKQDNAVDFPSIPMKENLEFKGWYSQFPDKDELAEKGYGEGWQKHANQRIYWSQKHKFSDYSHDWAPYNSKQVDPMYDGVFLLRADWFAEVTFNTQSDVSNAVSVRESEKVQQPANPTKEFAKFVEWEKDGHAYDFDTPVTGHMTLTAKWDDYAPIPQDVTITQGENFNPEAGIQNLKDMPAGTVVKTKSPDPVNTENYGEQTVTLEVTSPNEMGGEDVAEVEITLTINPKPLDINMAPQLEVQDKTITVGDELDLKSLITKASDAEDGDDLKDKVIIMSGEFDNSKAGEYEITFTLTDNGGAKVTKIAKVTVEDIEYTITFDLAGGTLNGQTDLITLKAKAGDIITLPTPTRENYKLSYWQGSKYQPGDTYTVTEDHTFTAVWEEVIEATDTTETTKPTEATKATATPQTGERSAFNYVFIVLLCSASVIFLIIRKKIKHDAK